MGETVTPQGGPRAHRQGRPHLGAGLITGENGTARSSWPVHVHEGSRGGERPFMK